MKRSITILNAALGALLTTLIISAGVLLFLMFTSSADETVHKAGLFGAVFFKTTKVNGGVTGSMGIGNIVPLIIIFGIFFVFFFIMQGVYRGLRDRRDTLLTTREDPSGKMS